MRTTSANPVHTPSELESLIGPGAGPGQLHRDVPQEQKGKWSLDATYAQASGLNGTRRILVGLVLAAVVMLACHQATAGEAPVPLGSAAAFAVLAGAAVTSAGISTVNGDLGSGPGTAVEGFPPGTVSGTIHAGDPVATQAEADLTIAYEDAQGRALTPITVSGNIGGQTLPPGLYRSQSSLAISSGDLTLDAQGDANAVWIFQMASTLTTTSGRQVILTGGAKATNVYWQVGSSATLGTDTVFKGTIMAQISITLESGAIVHGRALARTGAVTLDANTITIPSIPEPPRFGPIYRASDGSVTLVITNTPGFALTLKISADLTNWTTLTTLTPGASPCVFTNATTSGEAKRFYRALYEP